MPFSALLRSFFGKRFYIMKVVVGLGNPGLGYEKTLHNLGFLAMDKVAEALSCDLMKKKQFKAMVGECLSGGEKIILVKPLTFMNLSGEAVRAVVDFYKAEEKDLLVIYDDIDIEAGTIRYKSKGSAGTHNGMRNIVLHLGNSDFPRVRIGSKRDDDLDIDLITYVLSKIPKDKTELYEKAIDRAASCAVDFVKGVDSERLMNVYNTK